MMGKFGISKRVLVAMATGNQGFKLVKIDKSGFALAKISEE